MMSIYGKEQYMTMLEDLQKRLQGYTGQLRKVAKGSGVSLSTVRKIHGGFVPDPGIKTYEKLITWLNKQ